MNRRKHETDAALFAFAEERLDAADHERVTAHLSGCALCEERMREYQSLFHAVSADRLPKAPPDLLQKALAASQSAQPGDAEPRRGRLSLKGWIPMTSQTTSDVSAQENLLFPHRLFPIKVVVGFVLALAMGGGAGYWASQKNLMRNESGLYNPATPTIPADTPEFRAETNERLKHLAVGLRTYLNDWDDTFPVMNRPDDLRKPMSSYLQSIRSFYYPPTWEPFQPNGFLSRKAVPTLEKVLPPGDTITFYAPRPFADGQRAVVFLDGRIQTLTAVEWSQFSRLSQIPKPSAAPETSSPKMGVRPTPDYQTFIVQAERIPLRDFLAWIYLEERFSDSAQEPPISSRERSQVTYYRKKYREAVPNPDKLDDGHLEWLYFNRYVSQPLSDEELGLEIDPRLKNTLIESFRWSMPVPPPMRSLGIQSSQGLNWASITNVLYDSIAAKYALEIKRDGDLLSIKPMGTE